MVAGVVMPMNRLSWLLPMSTQALTAASAAVIYGGREIGWCVLLVVISQLYEVKRTAARRERRKEANEKAR